MIRSPPSPARPPAGTPPPDRRGTRATKRQWASDKEPAEGSRPPADPAPFGDPQYSSTVRSSDRSRLSATPLPRSS
jgi:hypothetical protein